MTDYSKQPAGRQEGPHRASDPGWDEANRVCVSVCICPRVCVRERFGSYEARAGLKPEQQKSERQSKSSITHWFELQPGYQEERDKEKKREEKERKKKR